MKNVATTWIDNKNTYDMVPQIQIVDSLKINYMFNKVITSIMEAMKNGMWNL